LFFPVKYKMHEKKLLFQIIDKPWCVSSSSFFFIPPTFLIC